MFPIRTCEEFRKVAAQVTLPAEEFVPERAPPEGHWRLRPLPSAQERNEKAQSLIEMYEEVYVGSIPVREPLITADSH
jgi:hypothetical protein